MPHVGDDHLDWHSGGGGGVGLDSNLRLLKMMATNDWICVSLLSTMHQTLYHMENSLYCEKKIRNTCP